MQNSLKNEVKYLNNLDLVRSWDLFQESACCLKDLYTDTNYGHKNLQNFIKTIKSVESFYRNSADVLIKKRERYLEIGEEKERLKLLKWFIVKGKHESLDKKKLLHHVYKRKLRRDKAYLHHHFNSHAHQHLHRRRHIGIIYEDKFHQMGLSNFDFYNTDSANNYLSSRKINVNSLRNCGFDVFNDAVNLKSLQGDLSDFVLANETPTYVYHRSDVTASSGAATNTSVSVSDVSTNVADSVRMHWVSDDNNSNNINNKSINRDNN